MQETTLLGIVTNGLNDILRTNHENVELAQEVLNQIKKYSHEQRGWYFIRAFPEHPDTNQYIQESNYFQGQQSPQYERLGVSDPKSDWSQLCRQESEIMVLYALIGIGSR